MEHYRVIKKHRQIVHITRWIALKLYAEWKKKQIQRSTYDKVYIKVIENPNMYNDREQISCYLSWPKVDWLQSDMKECLYMMEMFIWISRVKIWILEDTSWDTPFTVYKILKFCDNDYNNHSIFLIRIGHTGYILV